MRRQFRYAKSVGTHRHHQTLAAFVAVAATVASVLLVGQPAVASISDHADEKVDGTVITEWNQIAQDTLTGDKTKVNTEFVLYMAFVQAAVYNAVVGIEGGYEPYRFRAHAPRGASSAAAAIAAAHKILVTYAPYAKVDLDTSYTASIMALADDGKADGTAFGERAAQTLIDQRANDGRNAPVSFTTPPGPGIWRPTPTGDLPFLTPWFGGVTPLMVRSGAQFGEPGPPPALTSARYTRDFNEVKSLGAKNSTSRTPEQTATALFFSGSAFVQVNAALRDLVSKRNLDIVDAARTIAAADMSVADSVISVWHAKYVYGFWRPITAIRLADTDSNPATIPDPLWEPLIGTPNYPDYVSGYSGVICSMTAALQETLHTRQLNLSLMSTAVADETRNYGSGQRLCNDVVNARMWLGIHFRTADTAAARMASHVVEYAMDRNFEPVHRHHHGRG